MIISDEPIVAIGKYVRDLLNIDESLIKLGRSNAYFNQNESFIIVDNLAPAQEVSNSQSFDGDKEELTTVAQMKGLFTLNFYGSMAYEWAHIWGGLQKTQSAKDLQNTYGVSIYRQSSITNLKNLDGSKYSARYEISLNVIYNVINTINTSRFDSAEFNFVFNK